MGRRRPSVWMGRRPSEMSRCRTLATTDAAPKASHQYLAKHDGLVMRGITCGIDEGHVAPPGEHPELTQLGSVSPQLGPIASPKLMPAPGLMAEPLAQRRARREAADPAVDMSTFLRKTARPDSIDQDARAVATHRIVNPTNADRWHDGGSLLEKFGSNGLAEGRCERPPLSVLRAASISLAHRANALILRIDYAQVSLDGPLSLSRLNGLALAVAALVANVHYWAQSRR